MCFVRAIAWSAIALASLSTAPSAMPAAPPCGLAVDLMAEQDWTNCLRECRRILAVLPGNPSALLIKNMAESRLGSRAAHPSPPPDSAAGADQEIVRAVQLQLAFDEWARGRRENACRLVENILAATDDLDLCLRAACTLSLFWENSPSMQKSGSETALLVAALAPLQLRYATAAGPRPDRGAAWLSRLLSLPGLSIIALYHGQIGPALGSRCRLKPSCSEYARQAFLRHGAMGAPLAADRLIREPDVLGAARKTVTIRRTKYVLDPLCDHDYWWRRR